jgi:hypothetical protein
MFENGVQIGGHRSAATTRPSRSAANTDEAFDAEKQKLPKHDSSSSAMVG